jgi:hypothetical protein
MAGGYVLTGASTMTCSPSHLGAGRITIPPSVRLTVAGQGVLTMPGSGTAPITGCTQPVSAGSTNPCSGVVQVTAGASSRLRVDGVPVLLAEQFAATTTTGLPIPVYVATANQALLRVG